MMIELDSSYIILLTDPHLLICGQGGQDRTIDPDEVLLLTMGYDFDHCSGRGQGSDLFLHTVNKAWEHCVTTRQHNVGVHVSPDVNVTPCDSVEADCVDTRSIRANQRLLKQSLGAAEPFDCY